MIPSIGRIVHYKLCQQDVDQIKAQRQPKYHESMPGLIGPGNKVTKYYEKNGNSVSVGDVYPLVITRTWGTTETSSVNGQVLLDGNDTLWVTSVSQSIPDDAVEHSLESLPERHWMAPPRV